MSAQHLPLPEKDVDASGLHVSNADDEVFGCVSVKLPLDSLTHTMRAWSLWLILCIICMLGHSKPVTVSLALSSLPMLDLWSADVRVLQLYCTNNCSWRSCHLSLNSVKLSSAPAGKKWLRALRPHWAWPWLGGQEHCSRRHKTALCWKTFLVLWNGEHHQCSSSFITSLHGRLGSAKPPEHSNQAKKLQTGEMEPSEI